MGPEKARDETTRNNQSILALADVLEKLAEATLDSGPLGRDFFTSNEIAETLLRIRQNRPREG